MLALVEGRHATGQNAFRVAQVSFQDAESDVKVKVNEANDRLVFTRDNSFEIDEGLGSFEKPFSDWVCDIYSLSFIYSIK